MPGMSGYTGDRQFASFESHGTVSPQTGDYISPQSSTSHQDHTVISPNTQYQSSIEDDSSWVPSGSYSMSAAIPIAQEEHSANAIANGYTYPTGNHNQNSHPIAQSASHPANSLSWSFDSGMTHSSQDPPSPTHRFYSQGYTGFQNQAGARNAYHAPGFNQYSSSFGNIQAHDQHTYGAQSSAFSMQPSSQDIATQNCVQNHYNAGWTDANVTDALPSQAHVNFPNEQHGAYHDQTFYPTKIEEPET